MSLDKSNYINILSAIIGALLSATLGYWFLRRHEKNKIKLHAISDFKEIISSDLPYLEDDATAIGSIILELYPKHDEALRKLLLTLPPKKRETITAIWKDYKDIYETRHSMGVYGVIAAELPHPDFEPSIENVKSVEHKRKRKIVRILNEIISKL